MTDQPTDPAAIVPPEQPPMSDDASGQPDPGSDDVDETSTEDLSVQGGD